MDKVHVLVIQGRRCIKDCDGDFCVFPMIYEVEVFQTLEDLEVRQAEYRGAVEKIKEQAKAKIGTISEDGYKILEEDFVDGNNIEGVIEGIELCSLADALFNSWVEEGDGDEVFFPVKFEIYEREVG